jgi:hypothetical protein
MPYIGNITSDFSIDTGNITNRAVTATKLSPSSVGSNGQVLSVDGSGNLQWSADASGTALTGSTNNTITTVTGANAIQGEANLTFDGTTLKVSGASNTTQAVFAGTGGSGARGLEIVTESVGAADEGVIFNARASGTTGRLKFNTNSATAMTILGNGGNIGIGEIAPTFKTEIKVSDTSAYSSTSMANSQTQLRINNAGASGVAGILLTAEPSSGSAGYASIRTISPSSGSGDLIFSTRNASAFGERLRIQYDGKVGIGTASPAQLLEIHGASSPCVLIKDTTNNVISYLFADDTHAYVGSASDHPVIIKQNNGTAITIDTSKNATFAAQVGIFQDPTLTTMGATSGTWQVPEVDGSTIGAEMRIGDHNTNSTAVIRLASYGSGDGGVGGGAIMFTNTRCGSASHHSDLAAIKGARESLGKGYLRFFTASQAANTEKLRIASTGQILHSAASGDNQIISKRTNAAGSNGNYFFNFKAQDNNANDVGSFGFHRHSAVDNSRFVVHTRNAGGSNDERLRIDSGGYVGIGTANSVHRLSVKDTNATNSTVLIDNPIASSTLSGNTAANGYGHALCLENSEETTGNIVSLGFQVRTSSAYSNGAITAKAVDTSGNTQISVWTESGNAIGERLRIAPDGDLSISDSGTIHGVAKITVIPTSRTSAFSASDGDTWHDLVLHQGGSATNNAVGIAFQLKNDGSYHKNAGTGIAAVKNGTNSDYGSDLVFITRGQSTAATEKARILSSGGITFNGDTAAENALDDYEEGNLSWQLRKSDNTSGGNDNGSIVKYTKVGRMVCISGRIRTDSTSSSSSHVFHMDGTLPFTPTTPGTAVIGHWRSQDIIDGKLTASIAWGESNSTIYLYSPDSVSDYSPSSNNVGTNNQTNLVATFSFSYIAS